MICPDKVEMGGKEHSFFPIDEDAEGRPWTGAGYRAGFIVQGTEMVRGWIHFLSGRWLFRVGFVNKPYPDAIEIQVASGKFHCTTTQFIYGGNL